MNLRNKILPPWERNKRRRERKGKKKDTECARERFFKGDNNLGKEHAGAFVEMGRRPRDLRFTWCGNDGISLCTQLKSKSALKCTRETNKQNIPFPRIAHAKGPKEALQHGTEPSPAVRKHSRCEGTLSPEAISPR